MDTLSLIAAVADDLAIGRHGGMPWHISHDFKYFKRTTMGHPVIMGRGTWRSLGERALPGRRNIVVTHSKPSDAALESGALFVPSIEEALAAAAGAGEIFVIGGGSLYAQTIDMARRLYITRVHTLVEEADTYFPAWDDEQWDEVLRSIPYHDYTTNLDYEFLIYEKRR